MKKRSKVARDPNSMVPFIFSAVVILAVGLGFSYFLNLNAKSRPEQGNDAAALVLGLSIVTSGILFIAAWAKRK